MLIVGVFAVLALTASASNDRQTDLLSISSTAGQGAFDAGYVGSSADGLHVFIETKEQLVPADTDSSLDVYERFAGTTTLISIGPTGGTADINAYFRDVSADGSKVLFETDEQLTSSDTDGFQDVYQRSAGTTTEISLGPVGGNGLTEAFFAAASTDGSKIYFQSYEQLTSDDTDAGYRDIYLSSGGTTTLVSIGPTGGSGPFGAQLEKITDDGNHAYFHTDEALVSSDVDGGAQDLYDRSGSTTTWISTGPTDTQATLDDAVFGAATQDGSHVFFETRAALTSTDTDANYDVYDRSGSTTTELSLGPDGGNGAFDTTYTGSSANGSKVWFETGDSLVASDTDGKLDVYEHSGSTSTQISTSATGGNGAFDATFAGASQDGARVFFHTNEALAASDTDSNAQDVYERSGGTTTQVSIGPVGGSGPFSAELVGTSSDGARVFFHTYESLVSADNDGNWLDVYERYGGETTLLSTGPASTNAGVVAIFADATADGSKVFFQTSEQLTSADTDGAEDAYSATTVPYPGYLRPKQASPTRIPLVPAFQPCTSANRMHGPPLAYASCAPPQPTSAVLTVGEPTVNGQAANSVSSFKFRAIPGAPGPPDDSSLEFIINVTDVRCLATNAACPGGALSDYTGKLLLSAKIRLTDKVNGSPAVEPGTMQDFTLEVPVQCVATTSTTIGGSCNTITTANSLYPGLVLDAKRAVWQIDDVRATDAGPNGTGYGAGCPGTCGDGDETVFMRSGIFVP